LSGVVEPSELIKDPKISPFNIGEKIFLNDFSKSEFNTFILKAGLNSLDEIIKNRIFYWTNGNPRLTWDLCCIIEDNIEAIFDETSIDSLVKLHYLTAFDKPPIDNIREIVKKDSLIQDALIEIEYGKGDVISDNIKQKLYLAGIINYTENDVKIKNRIIKESISSQWVNSIRNQEENSLKKGIEFYNERLFKKAIQSIKSYLSQNNNPENNDDFNLGHFYLGLSYYFNNNFDEGLTNLNKVNFNPKQFGDLYSKKELFRGYIFQNTNRYEKAQEAFENILKIGINDEFYLSAKVNLALVLSLNEINIETSIKLLSEIAESNISDYNSVDNSTYIESKTVALFFLAEIEKDKNSDKYFKFIHEALEISPNKFKPGIIFSLYQSEKDIDKQKEHLSKI
jgi:tetratricopeptide (TPR) repeat protein